MIALLLSQEILCIHSERELGILFPFRPKGDLLLWTGWAVTI